MKIEDALLQLRNDFIEWVSNNLKIKVDKKDGMGLSTNDFTNDEKTKLANISESADTVSYISHLLSGTKIGTITINGEEKHIYASNVKYTSYLTNGTKIGTLNINDEDIDIYASNVSFEQTLIDGVKIGSININGENKNIYAPSVNYISALSEEEGTLIGTLIINGTTISVYSPKTIEIDYTQITFDTNEIIF